MNIQAVIVIKRNLFRNVVWYLALANLLNSFPFSLSQLPESRHSQILYQLLPRTLISSIINRCISKAIVPCDCNASVHISFPNQNHTEPKSQVQHSVQQPWKIRHQLIQVMNFILFLLKYKIDLFSGISPFIHNFPAQKPCIFTFRWTFLMLISCS